VSFSSEVLADSPIRYFKLDEQPGVSTAVDETGAENSTYFNATQGVGAVVGAGIRTVAASSAYVAPRVASGLTTAWSLEFWYKYDSSSGAVIWRDNTTGSAGWLMQLVNANADLTVRANGTDRTITGAGSLLTAAGWHHVVMTSSGTSVITYIDKVAVDTWTRTAAASTVVSTLRFGRDGSNATYYNAYYDEIAVYNTVLSSGRITAHYNAAFSATYTFGSYTVETFLSGSFTWTPPTGVTSYDALVVGAGGGGGVQSNGGGAGGAGGLLWLTSQSCTPGVGISGSVGAVGTGGTASSTDPGDDGGSSVLGSNTATGGGGGGAGTSGTTANDGRVGGSGGGGAGSTSLANQSFGAAGTSGQGSAGAAGFGATTTALRAGGGGGGKGSAGTAGTTSIGGAGGTGYDASADLGTGVGVSGWFASGGGGGTQSGSATAGTASTGGGGAGGRGSGTAAVSGANNTGGGGGGGAIVAAGHGGTGFVAVRYLTPLVGVVISPPAATATATAHAPTLSFTQSFTVAAVAATAAATALAPSILFSSTEDIVLSPPAATATATAYAPTLSFTQSFTVTPPAATATATAYAPVVLFADTLDVTISVPASTATATAYAPTIFIGSLPISTQTWNRAGGRVRGGQAYLEWTPPVVTPAEGHNLPEGTEVGPDEADIPFAKAYSDITVDADGNSVYHGRQTVYGPMLTPRIVIDGRDVTYWRGARTPIPDWQYTEPFGYGPAVFNFEGIGPHEVLGEGNLDWCRPDAKAKIQLVDHATQTVHSTVWRGQLEDFVEDDNNLQVIASGLWSGEAATRWSPMPLFGERKDIGQLIWRLSESVAGVRMLPDGGPTTGIENHRLGDLRHIEAINTLLQRAQTRTKGPFTLTPTPWGTHKFRMVEKDTETIDATFFGEGKQVKLQRVRAGEADRIFGRGTTPGGQRVRNGRYPGVLDDPDEAIEQADYPFNDDRSFGWDPDDLVTDATTDTGDGITILLVRMQTYGLLAREDVEDGTFNLAAEGGINRLRFKMGLELTGLVTPNVWDALFNVGRIGSSVWWSKIEPMAQTNWSIRWNTSADGSILSQHEGFDPDRRIVDKANDYGVWRREQMFDFSDKDLDEEQSPNIFGEVDFSDHGGLLRGSVDPGTVITDEDFMHQLELRPGMNIRFPFTRWGDIVLRFPTFSISGGSSPRVTGRGSTRPVDSLPLWEVLNEAKAARKDTDKIWWKQNRSSSKVSDAVGEFEEYGGQINPVTAEADTYRVVKVLAGQIGMIERFRIRTEPDHEFVAAVFGLPIGPAKLASVCPDPLVDKQGWIDAMDNLNDEHRLLALWGEPGDPGGYSPGRKSEGHALTGVLDDRAGFAFKTSEPDKFRPWVYLVLYSNSDTVFHGGDQGRIMWNQELVGL
jgi:hypothetical protein